MGPSPTCRPSCTAGVHALPLSQVCCEAEAATFFRDVVSDMEAVDAVPLSGSEAVAKALVEAATCAEATLIVTLTRCSSP